MSKEEYRRIILDAARAKEVAIIAAQGGFLHELRALEREMVESLKSAESCDLVSLAGNLVAVGHFSKSVMDKVESATNKKVIDTEAAGKVLNYIADGENELMESVNKILKDSCKCRGNLQKYEGGVA